MSRHQPLTMVEKELIYEAKLAGRSLPQVANDVGCSIECARKWWRRGPA